MKRDHMKDYSEVIRFAEKYGICHWKTPMDKRKSKLYVLYEWSDGDQLTFTLYKYKEDEDFDNNDIVSQVSFDSWDLESQTYEILMKKWLIFIDKY